MKSISIVLMIGCLWLGVAVQAAQEPQTLVSGQTVEREVAGGEVHTYRIELAARQFMRVVAEQKGADVTLTLVGPDNKQVAETDLTGAHGTESLSYEAAASGDYRLMIHALGATTLRGAYDARL